jgi:Family of unknown function (DUF5947)
VTLGGLKRFLDPRSGRSADGPRPGEKCELCTEPISDEHQHVVNIETRRLMCACRPCYLLFTHSGAAGGKLRAVPDTYRRADGFQIDETLWSRLDVPVRTAFFFKSTTAGGKFVAFYPSPAGATESTLKLDLWDEIVAQHPVVAGLEPDVQALLVHGQRDGGAFDSFIVPIDACYELVGRVRQNWQGFDGGADAWREIEGFFDTVRAKTGETAPP